MFSLLNWRDVAKGSLIPKLNFSPCSMETRTIQNTQYFMYCVHCAQYMYIIHLDGGTESISIWTALVWNIIVIRANRTARKLDEDRLGYNKRNTLNFSTRKKKKKKQTEMMSTNILRLLKIFRLSVHIMNFEPMKSKLGCRFIIFTG